MNTIATAEGLCGQSILNGQMGIAQMRALLAAGLKHTDPRLTPDLVGDTLDNMEEGEMMKCFEAVAIGLSNYFGAGKQKEQPPRGEETGGQATPQEGAT